MQSFSRRKVLLATAAVGIAGVLAGEPAARRYYRLRVYPRPEAGEPDSSAFDATVLETAVKFTGVMYGNELRGIDLDSLTERLRFLVSEDDSWRDRLAWLAGYVDTQSVRRFGVSFSEAEFAAQESVMLAVMNEPVDTQRARIQALFSQYQFQLRSMHRVTFRRLQRIYLTSEVPWRNRGYASWPGAPGDPREYARAGRHQ